MTVSVVSLAHFCLFADRALPSVLAPALRVRFGLSDTQLGALIGAAMIIPYAVATLAAGHLLGRRSPYRLMAFSILAWTIAGVAGALARSFGEMVLARMAFGLVQAAFAPTALALLATATRPKAPIATSVFTAGSSSGRSGGLLIGGLLLMVAGKITWPGGEGEGIAPWRLASLGLLLPNLILAAYLLMIGRAKAAPPLAHAEPGGLGMALWQMAGAPRAFVGHFAASAGAVMIAQAVGAWAPSLLNRRFDMTTAQSAIIVGFVVLICAPLGHLSAGRFAARQAFHMRGPAGGMALGSIGALLSSLALAASSDEATTVAALAGLVATGGFAAATSLIGLSPILKKGNRMAAMAVFFATTTLVGYGAGPLLTGILSDHMGGDAHELGLALAMVIAVSAAIVCIAGYWGSPAWRATVRSISSEQAA